MGLSRCSRCPIWCADATHTQNLAKSDPATTPAPWTVQWHLKALKSARGLRRNRISPRSFPRDTCDNLRPNRPWRSPRVKNQAIELANSSHWRGRCSHVDSVEKSAYAKHLRTNKDPPLPRSDPHLCPKSHKKCKVHLCREGRVVDAPVWRRGALDTGGGRQIRQPLKTRKPASRGTEG